MLTPYELYLKIAYHLAQEARAGLNEFKLPREFADQLLDYQAAAVRIAARHLNTAATGYCSAMWSGWAKP